MKPEEYRNRFYRGWQNPQDLIGFNISYRESDLTIFAEKDLSEIAMSILLECRKPIEETIENNPLFKNSLKPIQLNSKYPIVRKMISEAKIAGVGPMAGVAGAIAQCIGMSLLKYSKELIIENGGDLFISSKKDRVLLVYCGEASPFKNRLRINLKGRIRPYGVCTSSKSIGHSLNFGNTDATVIIADSALTADVFATAISNMVKTEDDIEKAVEYAKCIKKIIGGLIVLGKKASAWGDIELV